MTETDHLRPPAAPPLRRWVLPVTALLVTAAAAGAVLVSQRTSPEAVLGSMPGATIEPGVTWPVLYDDDASNWRAFGNRFWPHIYLADQEGRLRYDHIGEGAHAETEDAIRTLLGVAPDASRAATPV